MQRRPRVEQCPRGAVGVAPPHGQTPGQAEFDAAATLCGYLGGTGAADIGCPCPQNPCAPHPPVDEGKRGQGAESRSAGLFRVSQRATVAVVTPLLLVAGVCCSATGQLVVVCHGGVRGMATTTSVQSGHLP